MRRRDLDAASLEALLSGDVPPDDAPPGYGRVAAMLDAVRGYASQAPTQLDPKLAARLAAGGLPARQHRPRWRQVGRRRWRAAVVVIAAVAGTSGLATAEMLPPSSGITDPSHSGHDRRLDPVSPLPGSAPGDPRRRGPTPSGPAGPIPPAAGSPDGASAPADATPHTPAPPQAETTVVPAPVSPPSQAPGQGGGDDQPGRPSTPVGKGGGVGKPTGGNGGANPNGNGGANPNGKGNGSGGGEAPSKRPVIPGGKAPGQASARPGLGGPSEGRASPNGQAKKT